MKYKILILLLNFFSFAHSSAYLDILRYFLCKSPSSVNESTIKTPLTNGLCSTKTAQLSDEGSNQGSSRSFKSPNSTVFMINKHLITQQSALSQPQKTSPIRRRPNISYENTDVYQPRHAPTDDTCGYGQFVNIEDPLILGSLVFIFEPEISTALIFWDGNNHQDRASWIYFNGNSHQGFIPWQEFRTRNRYLAQDKDFLICQINYQASFEHSQESSPFDLAKEVKNKYPTLLFENCKEQAPIVLAEILYRLNILTLRNDLVIYSHRDLWRNLLNNLNASVSFKHANTIKKLLNGKR